MQNLQSNPFISYFYEFQKVEVKIEVEVEVEVEVEAKLRRVGMSTYPEKTEE